MEIVKDNTVIIIMEVLEEGAVPLTLNRGEGKVSLRVEETEGTETPITTTGVITTPTVMVRFIIKVLIIILGLWPGMVIDNPTRNINPQPL